jgi:predicted enzyme related to lactoylglutathione lyase
MIVPRDATSAEQPTAVQMGSSTGTHASGRLVGVDPLLRAVDAVTIPVPSLDTGLAFYRDALGHELLWRNEQVGQLGLRIPGSETEIVLSTEQCYEPDWRVESADAAADVFRSCGGEVVIEPIDIPIGRLAVVADPFGNRLVLLDGTKGTYQIDDRGIVTGVS